MYEAPSSRLTLLVVSADAVLPSTQSAHENRIYSVNIHCGDSYPDSPPTIQFVSKVNLPCVDQRNGKVQKYAGWANIQLILSRSIRQKSHAWPTGREITIWRQFSSNYEGTDVIPQSDIR